MKKEILMGSVGTLSDLHVWVQLFNPKTIIVPKNHIIRYIREFNPESDVVWHTYRGIPIKYE